MLPGVTYSAFWVEAGWFSEGLGKRRVVHCRVPFDETWGMLLKGLLGIAGLSGHSK